MSSSEHDGSHMMRSAVLVSLESFLGLLLKTDKGAQRASKRLAASQTVVEIQTFMPSERFYATFSPKGILLDAEKPQGKRVGVSVLASTPDMLRAFITGSSAALAKLQIDGDPVLIGDMRALMNEFTLSKIVNNWFSWSWMLVKRAASDNDGSNERDQDADRSPRATPRTVRPLLRKIDTQQSQMDRMNLAIKERAFELVDLKKQVKRTRQIAALVIGGLLLWIAVLYYLMYF